MEILSPPRFFLSSHVFSALGLSPLYCSPTYWQLGIPSSIDPQVCDNCARRRVAACTPCPTCANSGPHGKGQHGMRRGGFGYVTYTRPWIGLTYSVWSRVFGSATTIRYLENSEWGTFGRDRSGQFARGLPTPSGLNLPVQRLDEQPVGLSPVLWS